MANSKTKHAGDKESPHILQHVSDGRASAVEIGRLDVGMLRDMPCGNHASAPGVSASDLATRAGSRIMGFGLREEQQQQTLQQQQEQQK